MSIFSANATAPPNTLSTNGPGTIASVTATTTAKPWKKTPYRDRWQKTVTPPPKDTNDKYQKTGWVIYSKNNGFFRKKGWAGPKGMQKQ